MEKVVSVRSAVRRFTPCAKRWSAGHRKPPTSDLREMKQTAPISLDSFDPEVLAAAREVARRAGVPLESWIASVATPDPSKPGPRRRRAD
ncbi:hypothetical protein, partial [Methylorubrum extorquens]|uniref:hypothetical protein n=1 Tax=Methylorubrum extorquens TaxID=408 RepID=UPI00103B4EB4